MMDITFTKPTEFIEEKSICALESKKRKENANATTIPCSEAVFTELLITTN
jgi:hypothetical protein